MQTFVVSGPKTFVMFAPQHSHSIMAKGRECSHCHASEIFQKVRSGNTPLTWMEQGKIRYTTGVIPVADGVQWNIVFQDRRDDAWVPIESAPDPGIHYAGFGSPLSKEQMERLSSPQRIR